MARSQFDDVERALELERARELRRAREPKLRTQDGRYVLGQRCRGCGYTKEERDLMEWHSQWREQGPPQCVTCKDGDRLTGRRLTPTHGQPVVCDDEDTCSFFPSLRRFLGMGTRRRRGTKKRGTKKHGTKKHGTKSRGAKRHGTKRRGAKRHGTKRRGAKSHGTKIRPGAKRHGTRGRA